METTTEKACPSSVADLQSMNDQLIAFLEYENAFTIDPMTERRIRLKLIELGIWPSQQNN